MASLLEYLLNRYADKTATPEEKEQLMRLLQQSSNDETVQQVLDKMIAERPVSHEMSETTAQAVLQAIFEAEETPVVNRTAPVRRMPYWRIAAAAVVLLMVTAAGLVWMNYNNKNQVAVNIKNDVAPGGNKAVLTLANGSTIVLDNEKNGVVAQEGNAKVVKLKNGQLMYAKADDGSVDANAPIANNTLSTPKGGQYNIELPDGSKVWLNAASSITYPTAFDSKERKVQVTGEAYFEVAKLVTAKEGKRVPFIVDIVASGNNPLPTTGGAKAGRRDLGQVQVLGTHFNINAYEDEAAVKTTLLEGSVKFTKDVASALLKPGEQVSLSQSSHLSHPIPVQTDAVMAWKNGVFHFENADIKTVMRQVSRWYDVDVVYKRSLDNDDPLFFEVTRNTNLSDVLRVLNLAGGARYSIQDKKVIVQ